MTRIAALTIALVLACGIGSAGAQTDDAATTSHAVAIWGEPKYGPDFKHLDYVNPDAPKGGTIVLSYPAPFDKLNPFTLQGTPAPGVGFLYETLMTPTADEQSVSYGLVAESITIPASNRWVEFNLRPEARWHDGEPITAEDVVWSFNTLMEDGSPFYANYYADVEDAVAIDADTVRFNFKTAENNELPYILGQVFVLPKHDWEGKDFTASSLEPPLGSGPYRVANVSPGRSITYERVEDWWGADLPINRGQYNFDRIQYDIYRDPTVAFEAFKAGQFDFRAENVARNWARGYDVPAVEQGRLIKAEIPTQIPQGMQGFFMNTRRPVFADPRVREGINLLFPFEFVNDTLFFGLYERIDSYFSNSELASRGRPEGEELEILEQYRDQLPPELFNEPFVPASADDPRELRRNLRDALDLFRQAGWEVRDGALTNVETGQPFRFELLLDQPTFERVAQPFARNLARAGIDMNIRIADSAQYQALVEGFDYDMIVERLLQSTSPGNEQREYWTSEAAKTPGTSNYTGVSDPVVDALVEGLINADDRDSLVAWTRALDRVLLWDHYVVPHWSNPEIWLAYWNRFSRPDVLPPYGVPFATTWWIDPDKNAGVNR
ncbi:extracellular solute-binding protein [Rhodospirillaceae bacterium SYSU D60014]|uniref:extracellular solute-binding protein n=1 Tax=Virgifigura deserti TaxID=2268457 RepID=UPI000E667EC9